MNTIKYNYLRYITDIELFLFRTSHVTDLSEIIVKDFFALQVHVNRW